MWPFDPPPDAEGWTLAFGTSIVLILLGILGVLLWIWALIHAIRNPAASDVAKIVWAVVILFLPIIGAILYAIFRPRATIAGPMQRM